MLTVVSILALALASAALATEPGGGAGRESPAAEPDRPSVDTLLARAQLLAVKQDWSQAEETFRAVLDKDPERAEAWRGLGYVLRKQGHGSDARVAYEKALALAPADPDTLLGLGETYVAVGRTPDAKLLLERLRAVDRRHAATLDHVIKRGTPR